MDDSVLNANYPGFHDFVSTNLVDLKDYFRNLYKMSDQYRLENGHRHLIVQNKQSEELITLDLIIKRVSSPEKITEEIHYVLPNGNHFDIVLVREGMGLVPIEDDDLLNLKVYPTSNLTRFDITFVQLDSRYQLMRTPMQEEGFFKIGLFELTSLVETFIKEDEVSRNYIFFISKQPQPQTSISVKAVKMHGSLNEISFLHYSPTVGEMTPQKFFTVMSGVTSIFKQLSQIFVVNIIGMGFPKL